MEKQLQLIALQLENNNTSKRTAFLFEQKIQENVVIKPCELDDNGATLSYLEFMKSFVKKGYVICKCLKQIIKGNNEDLLRMPIRILYPDKYSTENRSIIPSVSPYQFQSCVIEDYSVFPLFAGTRIAIELPAQTSVEIILLPVIVTDHQDADKLFSAAREYKPHESLVDERLTNIESMLKQLLDKAAQKTEKKTRKSED